MTVRPEIKCNFCEYSACASCVKQYLTASLNDAHCMNCKRAWDIEFLENAPGISHTFLTGAYREHRREVLFERQRAMLPLTQPYVEKTLQMRRLEEEISARQRQLYDLKRELSSKEIIDK